MNCTNFKTPFLALFTLGICLAACDQSSTSSSETLADTTAMMDTTPIIMDTGSALSDTSATIDTSTVSKPVASATPSKKRIKVSIEKMATTKHFKYTIDKAGVYDFSEIMPAFKSGDADIEDYINSHIEYPQPALDDSKEGKVNVAFIVDENGKVTNARSMGAKLGSGLDEEATRVVSNMPQWTPGKIKGKPVKVSMSLPIIFKIEE